jgi:hypothetical protein
MSNLPSKKSQQRLVIAGSLFFTSILASFLISYLSQSGSHYWVLKEPLPRGVQIQSSHLVLIKATLGQGVRGYLNSDENPIGSITRRNLNGGELINAKDLSNDVGALTSESLSISIRAADIGATISPGDLVSLYQVHDARNGEAVPAPIRILTGVFIRDLSRKSANFGSEISLTLSVDREDVATLLAATSSGRIVVVSSNGF